MKRLPQVGTVVLLVAAAVLLGLAWREIGALRDEVARLRMERESRKVSGAPPAASNPPRSRSSAATVAGNPAGVRDEAAPADKKGDGAMDLLMGAGKKEIEQRSEARLKLLGERLKLRPDQLAALRKDAATRSEALEAAFERVRNNTARPPDFGVLMDWTSGRFDLPVKDLLDADQSDLFAAFEAGERNSRIENLVNMELVELGSQGSMHLTPEQKDQAFARLTEITAEEDAMGDAYFADDAGFAGRIDESLRRRREALQSVFDASQLENYDRVLVEDRTLIMTMFGGGKAAAPANSQAR